jgi:hypothetical protein
MIKSDKSIIGKTTQKDRARGLTPHPQLERSSSCSTYDTLYHLQQVGK